MNLEDVEADLLDQLVDVIGNAWNRIIISWLSRRPLELPRARYCYGAMISSAGKYVR